MRFFAFQHICIINCATFSLKVVLTTINCTNILTYKYSCKAVKQTGSFIIPFSPKIKIRILSLKSGKWKTVMAFFICMFVYLLQMKSTDAAANGDVTAASIAMKYWP